MYKETLHYLKIARDVALIGLSVTASVYLARHEFFLTLLSNHSEFGLWSSLVSGMFFTSIFTTALSIASFSAIAHTQNIFITASIGAIGAVIGDLFLFTIFRKTLRKDVDHITSVPKYDKYFSIFRRRMFRWIIPLVGALIIASPLPDELGIAMMGLSSMRVALLIPISFTMNFLGILLIGAAALAF